MITCLGLPPILVARAGLGTINHTFLTIEHARKRGVAIIGVIPYDEKISAGDAGNIFALVEKNAGVKAVMGFPHKPHQALNGKTPAQVAGLNLKLGRNRWMGMILKSVEHRKNGTH